MSNQWRDWSKSALTALATVILAVTAFAQPPRGTQPPRIGDNSSEFGAYDRMIKDGLGSQPTLRSNPLGTQPAIDVSRVDRRQVQNLLNECVAEAERLYRALEADYRRSPAIRPFLSDVISMRARAARAAQDVQTGTDLRTLLPEFQQLGSEWRNASHQMAQARTLSPASLDSIGRIDRLERELEKLFRLEPQFDRRALLLEFSKLSSAAGNLVQELELDRNNGDQMVQLIYDARKLDQQAYILQQRIVDNYSYTDIVNEYGRFSQMWRIIVPKLRSLDNRYIERGINNVVLADNNLHDLLWIEQQTNSENLKMIADSLARDVDEFFSRVPLKLLLHFKDVASILQTADDFYGTVQNLQDCIERKESERVIHDSYRHVEEYGVMFVRNFEPLRSSAGRIVLREIEDGMMALRKELNIAGTVSSVDSRELIPTAARLENLADHLQLDVSQWLNYERPAYRAQATQDVARFVQRTQSIHRMLQSRPTATQLKKELDDLYVEFEAVYLHLGRCNTEHRRHLKDMAYDIGSAMNTMRTPLSL